MCACIAVYCHSRASKKIPGITFHRFPKDEKRRAEWVEAVNRKNWQPSDCSVLCSLHFEEDMFERQIGMRRTLVADAIPTIFPVFQPGTTKVMKNSKKQPKDPAKVTLRKEPDPDLAEPLFISHDGTVNKVRRKRGPSRQPIKVVTPIAVEKLTKPGGISEEPRENQESENPQRRDCPIASQEPCVSPGTVGATRDQTKTQDVVPDPKPRVSPETLKDREVGATQDQTGSQDIVEIALRKAMDEDSPASKESKRPKKKTRGVATTSVMNVNLVCPHCQKACKVCLSVKPRPPRPVVQNKADVGPTLLSTQARHLWSLVQRLQQKKQFMRKKVKILQQSVRRLRARNDRLQRTGSELVVIGTINGVLDENDV